MPGADEFGGGEPGITWTVTGGVGPELASPNGLIALRSAGLLRIQERQLAGPADGLVS